MCLVACWRPLDGLRARQRRRARLPTPRRRWRAAPRSLGARRRCGGAARRPRRWGSATTCRRGWRTSSCRCAGLGVSLAAGAAQAPWRRLGWEHALMQGWGRAGGGRSGAYMRQEHVLLTRPSFVAHRGLSRAHLALQPAGCVGGLAAAAANRCWPHPHLNRFTSGQAPWAPPMHMRACLPRLWHWPRSHLCGRLSMGTIAGPRWHGRQGAGRYRAQPPHL